MFSLSQRARSAGPQPLWLRVAAFVCVLLVCVAGVAQAAHIHGELLPSKAIQASAHVSANGATGEDGCPLCVAMHSALPVTLLATWTPGLLLQSSMLFASSRKPRSPWTFAAFSRPPPALL